MSDINSGSESSAESDKEYEVETILGHRKKHLKGASVEYNIRWKGFDASYDTWEPEENLDCKAMLVEYHKKHPKFEKRIVKNKLKRKRSVIEIKDDEAIEIGIDEPSVKPLSPMPSDSEDKEEKIREEKRRPSKKKVKKERINLDSKLTHELEKTSPISDQVITDQKKKSKKIPGDIEENIISKSTENNQETSAISVIESKSPVKKRQRMRITKKRAETEAESLHSALPSTTAALSQTEKQPLQPTKTNLPKAAATEVQALDSTKENTLPGEKQQQIEDQNANQTREVNLKKNKSGFDQGLVPDEIVGATNIGGFKFLLKWKGVPTMEFVDNETAKKKIPLLVIKFYEARIHFDHKDVPLNSPFHPLATGDGNL